MELSGFYGLIYKACVWIMRLAYLNVLWIAFTLLGLLIFGLGPATSAMFSISRKWIIGEDNIPVFRTFLTQFRSDFRKIFYLSAILFSVGALLLANLMFFTKGDVPLLQIAKILTVNLAIVYGVMLIYIFPVFCHFDLKLLQYLKQSFYIGFLHPVFTLFLVLGMVGIGFVFLKVPGLMLFFSGSSFSLFLTWGAHKAFSKLESKKFRLRVAAPSNRIVS
ncbi:DUF624 domain-containing protein [Neobacillus pocheonensis]|uniref:YesL family protein n=1 Tax=Neobacillus pocheonensis TaxID=363869 RepID=UPI003D268340